MGRQRDLMSTESARSVGGHRRVVWLAARVALCGILAASGAVTAVALSETALGQSGGVEGLMVGTEVTRGAPSLPFRGVIGYYGDIYYGATEIGTNYPQLSLDSPMHEALLYKSSDGSNLAYVPIGNTTHMCGPGLIYARPDGVEVVYARGVAPYLVGYQVPWGDEAYPRFVFSDEASSLWLSTTARVSEDLEIEVMLDNEGLPDTVLGISKGTDQRFYEATAHGTRFLGLEYVPRQREYSESGLGLAGSDGEYYGYHITGDLRCGPHLAVVVSASTGEFIMCGWDRFGPVFVNFDEYYSGVGKLVFPADEPTQTADCDRRMNILELGQHMTGDPDEGLSP